MKFKFKTQEYQTNAVKNICKVFEGQPYLDVVRYTRDLGIKQFSDNIQGNVFTGFNADDDGFENAKLLLDEARILENIKKVQIANQYKVSDKLIHGLGRCTLDIEMETGTGKTYVYIKTIFELNKMYGWSKFIIVVPSVAIREGVKKSFEITKEHFMEQYGKKANYFIYNSKRLGELDSFASSSNIQVMIINNQAFNSKKVDAKRIYNELDAFQSRKPIDVISKTRPILILDEPQKLGGKETQAGLVKFNPLFSMNFSATHKKEHNLVYALDALDAYNQSLVKKIQVKGFEVKNLRGTDGYLYLQEIKRDEKNPPKARLEFEIKYNKSINREMRLLKVGDNLYPLSKEMEQYKDGYKIEDINPYSKSITFLNGEVLQVGEVCGDISEEYKRRIQIRETIQSHFEKEESLFNAGIKCLSLFFIDAVKNYRDYSQPDTKGIYAKIFEEEYKNILKNYIQQDTPYTNYLKSIAVENTHNGYFSIDKNTGRETDSKDNKETGSDDIAAYDLILKNKERLLTFEEPTRFIFSHSALREGWDNPNIFQICALKQGGESGIAKRQEVGRGLRITVNQFGERMDLEYCKDRATFLELNCLTVIASDSYKNFVEDIQKDIQANLADRPTKATLDYFMGKSLLDGKLVDKDMASDIQSYLRFSGYIDKENRLTDKYFEDKAKNCLKEMPDILAPYTESIHKLVQGIFDKSILNEMLVDANKVVLQPNPLNENFHKKKFQALWKQINHKYIYTVEFDSKELIDKSVAEINESLFVTQLKYTVTIGEQKKAINVEQVGSGTSFYTGSTRTEHLKGILSNSTKYDLIGKISDGTKLTRKTVVQILRGIDKNKFNLYRINPEEFIAKVCKIVNEQKAATIVEHIRYDKIHGEYDSNIFTTNPSKIDITTAFKAKKAIQDYVVTDGMAEKSIERKFVEDLDMEGNEVCVYAKLPRSFQIPTPVGNYSPDWAIAFNDNSGVKHIFFVAETKGSMEKMQLRGIEKAKTECVEKLFNTLELANNVRYGVVDSYENLLNIMQTID